MKGFNRNTIKKILIFSVAAFLLISFRLMKHSLLNDQSGRAVLAQGEQKLEREDMKESTVRPIRVEKKEVSLQNCSQLAEKGRYEEALKCMNELIAKDENVFKQVYNTDSVTRFGDPEIDALYQKYWQLDLQGRPHEAIKYAEKLIPLAEEKFGKNHPNVENFINKLVFLYQVVGDPAKAEPMLIKILEIREENLGLENPVVLHSLYNLVTCYYDLGEFTKADELCERYEDKFNEILGSEHPTIATIIDLRAETYFITGDYAKSAEFLERSLAINEKVHGPDHYLVGNCMKNLALVHRILGNTENADRHYERSMAIFAKIPEVNHPDKAIYYARQGQHLKAHELMMQVQEMDNKSIDWIMGFASQEKKLKFMTAKRWELHAFLSHVAQYLINNPTAKKNALNIWLRRKGIILETQKRYLEASMYSADEAGLEVYEKLDDVRARLSKLTHVGPAEEGSELYEDRISELKIQKDKLELELSHLSRSFALKVKISKADCRNVAAAMQANTVLIEIARVNLFDFKAREGEPKLRSPHYFAFILHSGMGNEVELIDLGNADVIDRSISNFKKALVATDHFKDNQINAASIRLYNLVFAPLKNDLDGIKEIYISPDGNLNLIPLEVLLRPDGKFLIEEYTFNYLAAGRDILRFGQIQESGNKSVLMGDPEFYFKDFGLHELKYAQEELNEIERIIGKDKTEVYTGKEALEEVLISKKAPRFLHLATHGFFSSQGQNCVEQGVKTASRGWHAPQSSPPDRERKIADIENPLSQSGFYLAGASKCNSNDAGKHDGIVTAEKVLGLNLYGTEMVVLSACDTGLGEVRTGEGVFGLRRAFTQAGAQSLVMSMWKVPDMETKELMVKFYENIYSGGMNRCQALRQAALAMMQVVPQHNGHANPRYWGGFVFMGEP